MKQIDIKIIQSLKNKKSRIKNNVFLIEGRRLIESSLFNPFNIKIIYYTEIFKKKNPIFIKKIKNLNILNENISNKILQKITFTKNPSGIVALHLLPKKKPINFSQNNWVYFDKISDPGNLGTLLRSASWFNLKNIALSKNCVDPYNPKVVRSSMGSIFNLSIHLEVKLKQFSDSHIIIGSDQNGKNIINYIKPKRFVLIIGSESGGISEKNLSVINEMVSIKKLGFGESLNAATAGSIIMYQLSI